MYQCVCCLCHRELENQFFESSNLNHNMKHHYKLNCNQHLRNIQHINYVTKITEQKNATNGNVLKWNTLSRTLSDHKLGIEMPLILIQY